MPVGHLYVFEKVSIRISAHLLIKLTAFFDADLYELFIYFEYQAIFGLINGKYLSHSVGCLFVC